MFDAIAKLSEVHIIFEHTLTLCTTAVVYILITAYLLPFYIAHIIHTHWMVEASSKISHLDLGTGIGSVLMMMAWRFHPFHAPDNRGAAIVQSLGVEAQEDHANLARRSIALNGCSDTCRVVHADIATLLNGIWRELVSIYHTYIYIHTSSK